MIPPALPSRWAARTLVEAAEPLAAALRKGAVTPEELDRVASREVGTTPQFLARFALGRQAAMAGICAKLPGVHPLFDRPNLIIAERRMCVKRAAGEFCSRMSIDIVENAVTFVSRENAAAAAEAAVRQGIFDTVLEARLIQSAQPAPKIYSPLCDFERARIAGVALTVAAPDRLESTGISENDRAWIRAYETKERRIVAPSSKVRESGCGWWSLDPRTGAVVGRASGGRGWASNHPAADPGPPPAAEGASSQGATEYPVLVRWTTMSALTAGCIAITLLAYKDRDHRMFGIFFCVLFNLNLGWLARGLIVSGYGELWYLLGFTMVMGDLILYGTGFALWWLE